MNNNNGHHANEILLTIQQLMVEEALHGEKQHTDEISKPPMTIHEIIAFFNNFLHEFHQIQLKNKNKIFTKLGKHITSTL